jgi:hypothetical protein
VLLITTGSGETGNAGRIRQDEVAGTALGHGTRVVGLLNPDPTVRCNATFAALQIRAGRDCDQTQPFGARRGSAHS